MKTSKEMEKIIERMEDPNNNEDPSEEEMEGLVKFVQEKTDNAREIVSAHTHEGLDKIMLACKMLDVPEPSLHAALMEELVSLMMALFKGYDGPCEQRTKAFQAILKKVSIHESSPFVITAEEKVCH